MEHERGYGNLNTDQWFDYSHLVTIARTCHLNSSYTGTCIIWGNKSQELVDIVDHILLPATTFVSETG